MLSRRERALLDDVFLQLTPIWYDANSATGYSRDLGHAG